MDWTKAVLIVITQKKSIFNCVSLGVSALLLASCEPASVGLGTRLKEKASGTQLLNWSQMGPILMCNQLINHTSLSQPASQPASPPAGLPRPPQLLLHHDIAFANLQWPYPSTSYSSPSQPFRPFPNSKTPSHHQILIIFLNSPSNEKDRPWNYR